MKSLQHKKAGNANASSSKSTQPQKQGSTQPPVSIAQLRGILATNGQVTAAQMTQLQQTIGNRAVLQFVTANRQPVQLKRAENPYAWGDDVTSHHVIPHELLKNIMGQLSPDNAQLTKSRFLPDFANLTLEQLMLQKAVAIKVDGGAPIKTRETLPAFGKTKFGALGAPEQARISFLVNGNEQNFNAFQQSYASLQGNNSVDGMNDMRDAFYEWQSGNQFYGPERIEPGKSDEFDHDANLIYGQAHTASLLDINDKLRGLEGKPNKEAEIMTHLGTLSGLTKNKDIPGLDPSLWTEVDTEEKVAIVQNLLPTRPVLQGKSIHKEVVRKALVPLIKLPKDGDVYTLLTHLKSGANSTTSAEIIVNGFSVTAKNKTATGGLRVSRAGTTLDVENQFPQQRSTLKKVDVSSEIVDMMKEHVNTIKTMLGL